MRKDKPLKNHLHNTLGITKAEMEQWMREETRRLISERLERLFEENSFRAFLRNEIARICQGKVSSGFYNLTSFEDYFKKEMHSIIRSEVTQRINFKINVENAG